MFFQGLEKWEEPIDVVVAKLPHPQGGFPHLFFDESTTLWTC